MLEAWEGWLDIADGTSDLAASPLGLVAPLAEALTLRHGRVGGQAGLQPAWHRLLTSLPTLRLVQWGPRLQARWGPRAVAAERAPGTAVRARAVQLAATLAQRAQREEDAGLGEARDVGAVAPGPLAAFRLPGMPAAPGPSPSPSNPFLTGALGEIDPVLALLASQPSARRDSVGQHAPALGDVALSFSGDREWPPSPFTARSWLRGGPWGPDAATPGAAASVSPALPRRGPGTLAEQGAPPGQPSPSQSPGGLRPASSALGTSGFPRGTGFPPAPGWPSPLGSPPRVQGQSNASDTPAVAFPTASASPESLRPGGVDQGMSPPVDQADDAELARVILGLPRPMAEAAIARGVLGPQGSALLAAGAAPMGRTAPERGAPPSGAVASPGADHAASGLSLLESFFLQPSSAPDAGGTSSASGAAAPSAPPSAAPASSLIARAPEDRALAEAHPVAGAQGGAAEQGHGGASGGGEADLDQLADEVFHILRWRLEAERERDLHWS